MSREEFTSFPCSALYNLSLRGPCFRTMDSSLRGRRRLNEHTYYVNAGSVWGHAEFSLCPSGNTVTALMPQTLKEDLEGQTASLSEIPQVVPWGASRMAISSGMEL